MRHATEAEARARVWEYFGDDLKAQHYKLVYFDPAWKFSAGPSRNPSKHYKTMSLKQIAAMPIRELGDPAGARFVMWTTVPHLRNGIKMFDAWGIRYSTARFWLKLWSKEDMMFLYPDSFARGTGYEVIGNIEVLLIGKIGKPPKIIGKKPSGVIFGQRRDHSRKPSQVRLDLKNMFEGPRAELFSRTAVEGFDHWGNDKGRFED